MYSTLSTRQSRNSGLVSLTPRHTKSLLLPPRKKKICGKFRNFRDRLFIHPKCKVDNQKGEQEEDDAGLLDLSLVRSGLTLL